MEENRTEHPEQNTPRQKVPDEGRSQEITQILKLDWKEEKPTLILRHTNETYEKHPLIVGTPLTIALKGPRLCTGTKGRPCPYKAEIPEGGMNQCPKCNRQEVSYYDFIGKAKTHKPTATYYQNTDHNAYLALYDPEHIKVGVTSRGITRLLEQGASAALIFASDDGLGIRDIEAAIRSLDGIIDRVQMPTRMKVLENPPEENEARQLLKNTRARIETELPEIVQDNHSLNEFHYLMPHYNLRANAAKLVREIPNGAIFTGEIEGVIGQLIVLQGPSGTIALDAGRIRGHYAHVHNEKYEGDPEALVEGEKTLF